MSLTYVQNEAFSVSIILASGGTPVTGVIFSDVTVYVSKAGGTPTSIALTNGTFTELDSTNMPGVYHVDFASSVSDTLGEIILGFSGGTFDPYYVRGQVVAGKLSDLSTQVTTLQTSVTDLDSDVASVQATTTSIASSIGSIDSGVSALQAQVTAVQGTGFDTATDSLVQIRDTFDTRVPSGVALQSTFVNGTGNATAPTNIGLWDVLGDGTVSISEIGLDIKRVLGLSQENFRITNHVYDANNNLISGVITTYPSSTDLENSTNTLATYVISASYDSSNRLLTYEVKRN